MSRSEVGLAVFDLDGTLTRRDTLFPYALGFLRESPGTMPGALLRLPLPVIAGAIRGDRGEVKSAVIRICLGGSTREQIDEWNARFVPQLLQRGMHQDALSRLEEHKRAGARLILLSASTDLYVPAIGTALGFHETVCTGVRWNGERLDGHLTTANRRAEEKARCVAEIRARYPGLRAAAYGNAGSDLAHLRLVEEPLLVNGSAAARHQARQLGIPCARWH